MISLNVWLGHFELGSVEVLEWETRSYLVNIIVLIDPRSICQIYNQLTIIEELPKLL